MKLAFPFYAKETISVYEIVVFVMCFCFLLGGFHRGIDAPFLLSIPYILMYVYVSFKRDMKRSVFNTWIVIAFFIFYIGLKVYRGMDSIGNEGDRDDQLYQSVINLLQGIYPYDKLTFLNNHISAGPTSLYISLPFVALFNNINIVSVIVLLFLVLYVWKYVEPKTSIPILPIFLSIMIFVPCFRWEFFEAGEEVIYGWMFIYMAVWLIHNQTVIQKMFLKSVVIGILLGIAFMVRVSYMFPIAVIMMLLFLENKKQAFVCCAGIVMTTLIFCLPFLLMDAHHFITQFIGTVWLQKRNDYGVQMIVTFFILLFPICYFLKDRISRESQYYILISAVVFFSYLMTGFIGFLWHAIFWMTPLIIATPFLYKEVRNLCTNDSQKNKCLD